MTQTAPRATLSAMTGKTHLARQRQLIHVFKRDLNYTDDEYRAQLRALTGYSSAADLDRRDCAYVLDVFSEYLDEKPAAPARAQYPAPGTPEYDANTLECEDLLAVA